MNSELEFTLQEKLNVLRKRNANHLTPRKEKKEDDYSKSRTKWENLKDSVLKYRSQKIAIQPRETTSTIIAPTSTRIMESKSYKLPALWTIQDYPAILLDFNGILRLWTPPVVFLKVDDIMPMFEMDFIDSAYDLLTIIGNSNLSPYWNQKQNTTARFYRQWANIELSYSRFDEAIEVLELGIQNDAQPCHELIENRDKIRNKLIQNRKDAYTTITPLKTPLRHDSFDQDSFSDAFSEIDLTPTKQKK